MGFKEADGEYPERSVKLSVGEEEAPAEANDKEITPSKTKRPRTS